MEFKFITLSVAFLMFCSSCSTTGVSENLKYLDDSLVSYSVVGASFSIDPIIQDRNETLVNATLEAPIGLTGTKDSAFEQCRIKDDSNSNAVGHRWRQT